MFTAAEYHTLLKRCPEDLQRFLAALSVARPSESAWEDAAMVRALDEQVSEKMVRQLCSKSLLDGCYSLLERAGVAYQFSDTIAELLQKIAENRQAVRAAMVAAPEIEPDSESSEPAQALPLAQQEASKKKLSSAFYYWLGVGALGVDLAYLLFAATYSTTVAALLGLFGAAMLFQGRRMQMSGIAAPSRRDEEVVWSGDVSVVRFSEAEAEHVLETLLLAKRLYQVL